MTSAIPLRSILAALAALSLPTPWAFAGSDQEAVELIVEAGTPLRVALDQRTKVKHVGQEITATAVQPVYAFDRVVIPVGARVEGALEKIQGPSATIRVRSLLKGDLNRHSRRSPRTKRDS